MEKGSEPEIYARTGKRNERTLMKWEYSTRKRCEMTLLFPAGEAS